MYKYVLENKNILVSYIYCKIDVIMTFRNLILSTYSLSGKVYVLTACMSSIVACNCNTLRICPLEIRSFRGKLIVY